MSSKTKSNAKKPHIPTINPLSDFETPFSWLKQLPEYGSNCGYLLSQKDWLRRHGSAPNHRTTFQTQPLKLFLRACLQTCISHRSNLSRAEMDLNWVKELLAEYSSQLIAKKINPQGFHYILNAMQWYISSSGCIDEDFKSLSKSAQFTVNCVKLMFYRTAQFPLKPQKQFATALVEDEYHNFEVMHEYVRILRKCRHQKNNETLVHSYPSNKELAGISQALKLDPGNYKIRITLCEVLFDFVQIKVATDMKPFTLDERIFRNKEDIVRFLDDEIRQLWNCHSRSVRLNNLATKLNICVLYRETFPDDEFHRFGFNKVYTSLRLNSNSSSANFLVGCRDIYHGKYTEAVNHFKQAKQNKPLYPKYTLAFVRALVASCDCEEDADKKLRLVLLTRKRIQNKIEFGKKYNWSNWNIQHLQFLNGCLTWIIVGFEEAFQEWLKYFGELPNFQEQFHYISPFGCKRLMLPKKTVIKGSTLLEHCLQLKKSSTLTQPETNFVNSLTRILTPKPAERCHSDLIIYNKFYLKKLRPARKMIVIKKSEEISLTSRNWASLQEKKVMTEIDQEKRLANQAWYKEEIMAHFKNGCDKRQHRNRKTSKVTEKKIHDNKMTVAEIGVNEFAIARSAFSKRKSKKIFPLDKPVA